METFVTIVAMRRGLSIEQIEAVCRELLRDRRRVSVRTVMVELRRRHGASGRTERVSRLLKQVEEGALEFPIERVPEEMERMREQLRAAEVRAARAEEIERSHQDYWARRYAEKADEMERQLSAALKRRAPISADEYLALHRRLAELTRRLAQYEGAETPGSRRE